MKRKPDDGTGRVKQAAHRNATRQSIPTVVLKAPERVVKAPEAQNNGNAHFRKQSRVNARQRLNVEVPTVRQVVAPPPMLCTEQYRPQTVREIVGNETAKSNLVKWVKSSPSVCLLSGPVGVGKTSLAHAIFRDTGRRVVDVCAEPGDLLVLMDDLVCTPPLQPIGVVVDEVENIGAPTRTFLARLLSRQNPAVHVILIAENAHEPAVKSLVNCASVCIKMHKPSDADLRLWVRRFSATMDLTLSCTQMTDVVAQVHGDVRQLVITLCEMKATATLPAAPDVWYTNPMDASTLVLRTTNLETGFKAASVDRKLVQLMTVKQLPHVATDIDDLAARMQMVSLADTLETYATLDHALMLHVYATSKTNKPGLRVTFPSAELGLPARIRANRDAINRVVRSASDVLTTHTRRDVDDAIVAQLHQDAALRDRVQEHVGKADLKRVLGLKLVIN